MTLPIEKESFRNLFPDIVVEDVPLSDFWSAWQISQEFKDKVKVFDTFFITDQDRWDTIAVEVYNDRRLWWIIAMFNDVEDPFSIYFQDNIPNTLKKVKVIKQSDISVILNEIRRKRIKLES